MTSVNGNENLEIGGGAGVAVGGGKGSDGAGIKPTGTGNSYTVYGDLTLPCDITIPSGVTVVIPEGASLKVPEDVTLTNNGTIQNQGGTFIIDGTLTGSGQHPADSRYTINFAEETITVTEGYSLYADESNENPIIGATGDRTVSISNYISEYNSEPKKLYLQAPEGEGGTSERTEITIPARPQALADQNIPQLNYEEEKLTFNPNISPTKLEFSTQRRHTAEWGDIPRSLSLYDLGWDGNSRIIYFRYKATENSFASSISSQREISKRPNAPTETCTVAAEQKTASRLVL